MAINPENLKQKSIMMGKLIHDARRKTNRKADDCAQAARWEMQRNVVDRQKAGEALAHAAYFQARRHDRVSARAR